MSRILVLAASHLTPALAFGAVPACVDMDAPSFSAVMAQLAAQVPFFRPEDYPTCASAAGVCRLAAAIDCFRLPRHLQRPVRNRLEGAH